MQRRTQKITAGLLVGVAFGLGAAAAGVTAVAAAPADECSFGPDGATRITDSICQIVVFGESEGAEQFELPAGISKLSAVLVGGGGGGYDDGSVSGGGGAGQVLSRELDLSGAPTTGTTTVQISAGAGGIGNSDDFSGGVGGTTSLALAGAVTETWSALGGGGAAFEYEETDGWYVLGGTSGDGLAGTDLGAGGGAVSEGLCSIGGLGYDDFGELVDRFPPVSTLWEERDPLGWLTGIAFGGDASYADIQPMLADPSPSDSCTDFLASPQGPGSGGSGFIDDGNDGVDGVVVLRYQIAEQQPSIGLSATSVPQNGTLVVTVTGLEPNETQLTAEIHSNPVALGSATANASGVATWTFNVPSNFQPGTHTAIVTRGAHSNQQLSAQFEVTAALAATGGPDLGAIGLLGGATVLAGAALVLTARARSRA